MGRKKDKKEVVLPTHEKVSEALAKAPEPSRKETTIPANATRVVIPWDIHRQILAAAHAVTTEVCGWAEADVDLQKKVIRLTKIAIPSQEASGGHAEAMAEQTFELMQLGELDIARAIVSWHSHVYMAANPSSTDLSLYMKMAETMPIAVGIVMNKRNEWHAEVWIRSAMGPMKIITVPEVENPPISATEADIVTKVQSRVKLPRSFTREYDSTEAAKERIRKEFLREFIIETIKPPYSMYFDFNTNTPKFWDPAKMESVEIVYDHRDYVDWLRKKNIDIEARLKAVTPSVTGGLIHGARLVWQAGKLSCRRYERVTFFDCDGVGCRKKQVDYAIEVAGETGFKTYCFDCMNTLRTKELAKTVEEEDIDGMEGFCRA